MGRVLSDQLPSSAVVTFLSVANPQPRPAGLVACLRSTRPRSGHFLSHVQEQLEIRFLGLGEQTAKLARTVFVQSNIQVNDALLQFETDVSRSLLPEPKRVLPMLDQIAGDSHFVDIARQRARSLAERIRHQG